MTQPTHDSFFGGGGGKSVSWKGQPLGTTVSGLIQAVHPATQQTDPATKEPKTKADGSPMWQVRIDLLTNERDPQTPDDDGRRGLYVSGWMQGAVGDAVRKAGIQNGAPQVGGTLTVRLTERTPNDNPALAPINKFDAHYVPPSPAGQFFDQQQQYGQPPAPQAPPQQFAPLGGQPQQFGPPQPQATPPGQQFGPPAQPGGAGAPSYPPAQQYPPQAPIQQPPPPQFQAPVPSMQPGGGYAVPPGTPLSPEQVAAQLGGQIVGQQPPAQQAAAAQGYVTPPVGPQGPVPERPPQITEQSWQQMDDNTKRQVAGTFANVPPF